MQRRQLAPGLEISRVVTGLWQLADMQREERSLDLNAAANAMGAYVKAGLTTFDMADHYGPAEIVAGLYLAGVGPGGAAQCLTKWVPRPGALTRDDVRTAVQCALDRLQVSTLDLLQFHAWNYADPAWLDALFWLDRLRAEGLIRHLGLTNFDTAHLRVAVASGVPVVSNQVCFSLLDRRPRGRMSEYCLTSGVSLLAYGTLAGGFLSDRWLGQPEPDWDALETWSQMKYGRFIRAAGGWSAFQRLLDAVHEVARKHGVSLATVASRSVLDEPAVAGIVVGARLGQREHIADTARVFELSLSDDDRRTLDEGVGALAPLPGDCGDEYRRPPYLTAAGDLSHHLEEVPAPYATRTGADGRRLAMSGTPWEDMAGYARAVRRGTRICVSGTTATHRDRCIGGSDPAAQAHFAIDKIEGALQSLGARLDDVVRTRIFVSDIDHWEAVARAHGERFGHIRPANTLVRAELIGSRYLVEIEADAEVGGVEGGEPAPTSTGLDTGLPGRDS